MTRAEFQTKWQKYNDDRRGTYEFRSRTRYKEVAKQLFAMGLRDNQTVLDVGAGSCQFGMYLRECGWAGDYIPMDAAFNGDDLETWSGTDADFIVCIEVVEHLTDPFGLVAKMMLCARHGLVLTTPNSKTVNVLTCDPTHVSIVPQETLELLGFNVEAVSWFGVVDDSLIGWRRNGTR